jgi:hypothetical protein
VASVEEMVHIVRKLLVLLPLLLVTPAYAAKAAPCVVTPDPVRLGTDTSFTVTASGATPFAYYEVTDAQKGHHKTDEDRVWLGEADASGTIVATVAVVDGRTAGPGDVLSLWPGDVSVKVIGYHQGGGPGSGGASVLATCGFTVVG